MNKAITDGLVLMPPPFSAGLNLWSREDGTPGSAHPMTGQPNAALVPTDQDFAGCLELQKTDGHAEAALLCANADPAGAVSAGDGAGEGGVGQPAVGADRGLGRATSAARNVAAVLQTGPAVALTTYGEVVTVQRHHRLGQPARGGPGLGHRAGLWPCRA